MLSNFREKILVKEMAGLYFFMSSEIVYIYMYDKNYENIKVTPYINRPRITAGANNQKSKITNKPTHKTSNPTVPVAMIAVLKIIPISLDIKPIITNEAKSSKLKVSPLSSVILFQGAKRDLINCDKEKKLTTNQNRLLHT